MGSMAARAASRRRPVQRLALVAVAIRACCTRTCGAGMRVVAARALRVALRCASGFLGMAALTRRLGDGRVRGAMTRGAGRVAGPRCGLDRDGFVASRAERGSEASKLEVVRRMALR